MGNEKRLIDAEAIARKLKNAHCSECNVVRKIQCSACWVDDVLELLEGDTVDAVEVVHGHWIEKPTGAYGRWQSWCSACGKHSGIGGIESNRHKPYCPNCGAKMMPKPPKGE